MAAQSRFEAGLERNPANFQPLTPLGFLERSATVFPDRVAIAHGPLRTTYAEFYARARQLGSALAARGIGRGDTVSTLLFNTPPMLEAHFGVPMCGAVLNTLNSRLDAATIAYCLDHGGSRLVLVDSELLDVLAAALEEMEGVRPAVVVYRDPTLPVTAAGGAAEETGYEAFLAGGDAAFSWILPEDEWDAISLNYTSGTTAHPKGVVYHHRGAHLLATGNIVVGSIPMHPVYLWTLPMFHCNGWCFPWTITLGAGLHVCLRQVRGEAMHAALAEHQVTHLCGAPIVMRMLLDAPATAKRTLERRVKFFTAAAPPPQPTLVAMREAGFDVVHLYGLTETYGPAVVSEPQPAWEKLDSETRAARAARQGVRYPALEALDVRDPETMQPVPHDGETLGEAMFRGNIVMKGYLGNRAATEEAFGGGWFHSGDLGVIHPDGYVELKDRAKDIIISGGENISSIEIEEVLHKHPAVAFTAVVAARDPEWGEIPCAFIETVAGAEVGEAEILAWCRERLAGFKRPKRVVFGELPKTSTGKIQKFDLRKRLEADL